MTTTTATTTAASVYQQLRGHLTDLKLADAADALPAVLEAFGPLRADSRASAEYRVALLENMIRASLEELA